MKRHFELMISTIKSGLDKPPDWRKTAFWRESSFKQAWQRAHRLPQSGVETLAEMEQPILCALIPASSWLNLHACACACWTQPTAMPQEPSRSAVSMLVPNT